MDQRVFNFVILRAGSYFGDVLIGEATRLIELVTTQLAVQTEMEVFYP